MCKYTSNLGCVWLHARNNHCHATWATEAKYIHAVVDSTKFFACIGSIRESSAYTGGGGGGG